MLWIGKTFSAQCINDFAKPTLHTVLFLYFVYTDQEVVGSGKDSVLNMLVQYYEFSVHTIQTEMRSLTLYSHTPLSMECIQSSCRDTLQRRVQQAAPREEQYSACCESCWDSSTASHCMVRKKQHKSRSH